MERESAVREILQSIGPLFPEDATRARAARKQPETVAEPVAEAAVAQASAPRLKMTTAPKPVLASQVAAPDTEKTEVANLAAVLERLAVPQATESVRDAVPELVRPVVPDVAALRAALDIRDGATRPSEPTTEPVRAFTELPPVEPAAVEPEVTQPSASELSEDEHDAFVTAVAAAILLRPPEPVAPEAVIAEPAPEMETAAEDQPVIEIVAPRVAETLAPVAEKIVEPVAPSPVEEPAVEASRAVPPKSKFKRHKPKKEARPAAEITVVPAAPEPESEPAATTSEDDELVRQIRTHRNDMIDVDDQLAKLDQDIASQQQMAQYVALIEQKSAYRSRLLRLRTSTQRFVETLQRKAEPVKRAPKKEKKSA